MLDASAAGPRDVGHIAIVGVDADQVRIHLVGLNVLNHHIAGPTVLAAVTAAAEQLADIDHGVVLDDHSAAAIVLNHLVLGILSSSALDQNVAGALEGNGIYARLHKSNNSKGFSHVNYVFLSS